MLQGEAVFSVIMRLCSVRTLGMMPPWRLESDGHFVWRKDLFMTGICQLRSASQPSLSSGSVHPPYMVDVWIAVCMNNSLEQIRRRLSSSCVRPPDNNNSSQRAQRSASIQTRSRDSLDAEFERANTPYKISISRVLGRVTLQTRFQQPTAGYIISGIDDGT